MFSSFVYILIRLHQVLIFPVFPLELYVTYMPWKWAIHQKHGLQIFPSFTLVVYFDEWNFLVSCSPASFFPCCLDFWQPIQVIMKTEKPIPVFSLKTSSILDLMFMPLYIYPEFLSGCKTEVQFHAFICRCTACFAVVIKDATFSHLCSWHCCWGPDDNILSIAQSNQCPFT